MRATHGEGFVPESPGYDQLAERLAAQFAEINQAGGLVAGSFGRAAYLGTDEFRARRQPPFGTRVGEGIQLRDIDVIGYAGHTSLGPFKVNTRSFNCDEVNLTREGPASARTWQLRYDEGRISAGTIIDELMEPVHREVLPGVPCATVSLPMHYVLLKLFPQKPRPNDHLAIDMVWSRLTECDKLLVKESEAFEPFRRVARANGNWHHPVLARTRLRAGAVVRHLLDRPERPSAA